ncbi:MAG: tetratricopeptide repeat protein [Wenzhouxiangellaceae bacterium]
MNKPQSLPLRTLVLVLAALLAVVITGAASAQDEREDDDRGRVQTLDPRVAEDLLEAYEELQEENFEEGLRQLDQLMNRRGDSMKDFDKASVLQVRGSAHVNIDDLDGALSDFAEALELNALPESQQNELRYNLAQLYFINERYQDSIRLFERWMQSGVEVTDTAYFMLGASHYNLEQYNESAQAIRNAIELASEPEQRYYELLNAIYSEQNDLNARTGLLEEMVEIWPGKLSYWRQLSALYTQQDDQVKAFAALEAAYLNGLIEAENDLVMLAQYYSTFNNPHRGAELLVEEMDDGRIQGNVENLELLSQLWSQAREHAKAIPVLREAAELSEDGELFFRLGQALLADENYPDAEQALESALDKGGLDDTMTAESWILLGTARFNQAEPGDREQRDDADQAFAQAEQYPRTRRQAADWRNYINAINRTERRQAALEQQQNERLAESARERLMTACRAQELAGSELTDRCREILAEGEQDGGGSGSTQ